MGVFLQLYCLPEEIDDDAWAEAYDESLKILRSYPSISPVSLKKEDLGFCIRLSYSHELESDTASPDKRHWNVTGDSITGEKAESFLLYRDIRYYRKRGDAKAANSDILTSVCHDNESCVTVFNEKTQGRSYHYPLLAVAIMLESRFSPYVMTLGDINKDQAKAVIGVAQKLTEFPLCFPVCTDANRLIKRLSNYYNDSELIEKSRSLFRGNTIEFWKSVTACADRDKVAKVVKKDLKSYAPSQIGAIRAMTSYLNATEDVAGLCRMACTDTDGPCYDPLEFSRALIDTWLTIEPEHYTCINALREPDEVAPSIDYLLVSMLLNVHSRDRQITFHINSDRLVEILHEYFPSLASQITIIVEKEIEKVEKSLKEAQEKLKKLEKRAVRINREMSEQSPDDEQNLVSFLIEMLTPLWSQCMSDCSGAKQHSRDVLWRNLVKRAFESGVLLTEDAWKWIDREEGKEVLLFLLWLLSEPAAEPGVIKLRNMVFENRSIIERLKEAAQ